TSAGRPMQMTVPTVTALEASTGMPSASNAGIAAIATFIAVPGSVTKQMSMPHEGDTAATSLAKSSIMATCEPAVAALSGVTPLSSPGGCEALPAAFENNAASSAAPRLSCITSCTSCSACDDAIISCDSTKMAPSFRGSRLIPVEVTNCRTGIDCPCVTK